MCPQKYFGTQLIYYTTPALAELPFVIAAKYFLGTFSNENQNKMFIEKLSCIKTYRIILKNY